MAEEFNEEVEMIINQEYKVWKKEAPYKYDFLVTHSLDWPSTTFQWLPEVSQSADCTNHYAIICCNTSEPDECRLLKIQVSIPEDGKCEKYMDEKANKITSVKRVDHHGEINRARYCYGNPDIIAASATNGDINLVSLNEGDLVNKLVSHTTEGYGLAWNALQPSFLLSGQADKRICIWDVEKNRQENQKTLPIMEIMHHNAPVEDVAWHKHHSNVFASCSDDRLLMIWDMRFRSSSGNNDMKPLFEVVAHTNEVYSLDFSPFNEFLLVSGSGDETTSVWDLRNLTRSLMTFNGEKNSVMKVQWSPFISTVVASCGYGRTLDIWDMSKDKKEQEAGTLFRHQGHRSKVLDFDWNKEQKLLMGSVEESNCLHIWQMAKSIYYEEDDAKP